MTQIRFANNGDLLRDIMPKPFTNIFDTLLHDALPQTEQPNLLRPRADISETEHAYAIRLAAPGFKKEDIQIELVDNKLTVSGEFKVEKAEESKPKFHLREIPNCSFSRTFVLPRNADAEQIEAQYTDGILQLTIPKSALKKIGKSIEIK